MSALATVNRRSLASAVESEVETIVGVESENADRALALIANAERAIHDADETALTADMAHTGASTDALIAANTLRNAENRAAIAQSDFNRATGYRVLEAQRLVQDTIRAVLEARDAFDASATILAGAAKTNRAKSTLAESATRQGERASAFAGHVLTNLRRAYQVAEQSAAFLDALCPTTSVMSPASEQTWGNVAHLQNLEAEVLNAREGIEAMIR